MGKGFLALLLTGACLVNGAARADEFVLCGKRGCGLATEDGKAAVPGLYEKIEPFVGDTALFFADDRWGLLNRKGETVARFGKDKPVPLTDGFVMVPDGDAYSLYRPDGKRVMRDVFPMHPVARQLMPPLDSPYVVRAAADRYDYHDRQGNMVRQLSFPLQAIAPLMAARSFDSARAASDQRWGYLDAGLNWVVPPVYKRASAMIDGVAQVETEDGYFLIDARGQPLNGFRAKEGWYGVRDNALAAVVHRQGGNPDEQWVVNKDGHVAPLPAGLRMVNGVWRNGFAVVETVLPDGARRQGLLDQSGRIRIAPKYEALALGENGWVIQTIANPQAAGDKHAARHLHGLLSQDGEPLLPPVYEWLEPVPGQPLLMAKAAGSEPGLGLIDAHGKVAVPHRYARGRWLDFGMFAMESDTGWQFFDPSGRRLDTPEMQGIWPTTAKGVPLVRVTMPFDQAAFERSKQRQFDWSGFVNRQGRLLEGSADPAYGNQRYVPFANNLNHRYGLADLQTMTVIVPAEYGFPASRASDKGAIVFGPKEPGIEAVLATPGGKVVRFSEIWP